MSRPRVLVADDHPGVSKAVCRLLALECDVVGSVADGRAALDAARGLRPDVVLVDIDIPGIDGLEACRLITEEHPEMKVVVFTATNDPEVRQQSFEAGASAFVFKMAGDGELLATVKRLCADAG
jgi:DNA-binding NarL/FixJ family response regulator